MSLYDITRPQYVKNISIHFAEGFMALFLIYSLHCLAEHCLCLDFGILETVSESYIFLHLRFKWPFPCLMGCIIMYIKVLDLVTHRSCQWKSCFYPRPVLAFGYHCRCLRLCMCVWGSLCVNNLLVCTITQYPRLPTSTEFPYSVRILHAKYGSTNLA